MADYRYLTTDIQTGAVLSELPLAGVSFQRLLNGAGRAKGQLKLSDPRVRAAFNPDTLSQPGRCGLAVLRNDVPLWGGVIWPRFYDFATEMLSIEAVEWFSALSRRKVLVDHSWNAVAVETAVSDLVVDAQTRTNGAWGMTVTGSTGLTLTASVLAADRPWSADAIKRLLNAVGAAGVDFSATVAYSGDALVPVLTLGSPLLGRDGPTSGLSIAEPISGTWSEDATAWAATVHASSRGVGATALVTSVTDTASLAGGYPCWELEYTSDSDATIDALAASAQSYLNARLPGGTFGTLTCRATDPDVSLIQLGDTIAVTFAPNPRFPDGLIQDVRITGWTLTPGENGGIDVLAPELTQVDT